MTKQTTRRAVLAGAATLPALSLPAIAAHDPIFAAIERHRFTWIADAVKVRERCYEPDIGPNVDDARIAHLDSEVDRADELNAVATKELAETIPTTMAGVLALASYVTQFNNNAIIIDAADKWTSNIEGWHYLGVDDSADAHERAAVFAHAILTNIGTALKQIAA